MWRPPGIREKMQELKKKATWSSSAESSSISSSSSSSSSSTSFDDEMPISLVRQTVANNKMDEDVLDGDDDALRVSHQNIENNYPSPWVHYDLEIQKLNDEIRRLKKQDKKKKRERS